MTGRPHAQSNDWANLSIPTNVQRSHYKYKKEATMSEYLKENWKPLGLMALATVIFLLFIHFHVIG